MAKKISDGVVRFQVVLTRETLERIDVVKERVNAITRAEVLRNALKVYDMIIEEVAKGNEILIRENGGDLSKIRLVQFFSIG